MGCYFSKENNCYSLSCCFCMETRAACYWIGGVGIFWGGFATCFDYIASYLPYEYCTRCLDYDLNAKLSFAGGIINSVQWVMSILLIHGARKEIRALLLLWMIWGVVSIGMQLLWSVITLPYTPTIRGIASIFQLIWGIHFFIIVKTHYTKLALTFTPLDEPLRLAPPNTPTRKHKRRKWRVDPNSQPPIRTLMGVALKLQYHLYMKKQLGNDDPDEDEEVIVVSKANDDNNAIPKGEEDEEREGKRNAESEEPGGQQPVEHREGDGPTANESDPRHDSQQGRKDDPEPRKRSRHRKMCKHNKESGDKHRMTRKQKGKATKSSKDKSPGTRKSYKKLMTDEDDMDDTSTVISKCSSTSTEGDIAIIDEEDHHHNRHHRTSYGVVNEKGQQTSSAEAAAAAATENTPPNDDEGSSSVCMKPAGEPPQSSPVLLRTGKKILWKKGSKKKKNDQKTLIRPISYIKNNPDDADEHSKDSENRDEHENTAVNRRERGPRDPRHTPSSNRRISYKIAVGHSEIGNDDVIFP